MTTAKSGPEPSMEEILASIRRIISEEGDDRAGRTPSASAPGDDVLELTQVVEEQAGKADAAGAGQPAPAPAEEGRPAPVEVPGLESSAERLVSTHAAAETSSAFSTLARAAEPDPLSGVSGGRTVEEIVVELLKPMLREWLDSNLPGIVERLVEREIRYLSRRPQDE